MEPVIRYCTTADGVSIAWAEAGEVPALLYCGCTPCTHVQEMLAVFEGGFVPKGFEEGVRLWEVRWQE